jgi:hypothetical protein
VRGCCTPDCRSGNCAGLGKDAPERCAATGRRDAAVRRERNGGTQSRSRRRAARKMASGKRKRPAIAEFFGSASCRWTRVNWRTPHRSDQRALQWMGAAASAASQVTEARGRVRNLRADRRGRLTPSVSGRHHGASPRRPTKRARIEGALWRQHDKAREGQEQGGDRRPARAGLAAAQRIEHRDPTCCPTCRHRRGAARCATIAKRRRSLAQARFDECRRPARRDGPDRRRIDERRSTSSASPGTCRARVAAVRARVGH